jgi:polysaccharide biosynthesis transport protein
VVPDASMEKDARAQMCAELKAAGFSDVTMLSSACQPSEQIAAGPRVAAA